MKRTLQIFTILIFFVPFISHAQVSPSPFLNWQAQNYVPSWYEGRVLPVIGSQVKVSLEGIQGGKLMDFSARTIRWFVNDDIYQGGTGLASLSFSVPQNSSGGVTVRAVVLGTSGNLEASVVIPVITPLVVIDAPYPSYAIPKTIGVAHLTALPFFFNIQKADSLSYNWSVNGIQGKGNVSDPTQASLDLSTTAVGDAIEIDTSVQNPFHVLELSNGKITLNIQ